MNYTEYLQRKQKRHVPTGIEVETFNAGLFPFQSHCVMWALKTGRACLFAGTGLGKTRMQVEYAHQLKGVRLILAPLAVNAQTINEAASLGVKIKYVQSGDGIHGPGIYITNYDRIEAFADVAIDAVILDESSIIKGHDGKYREYIQERFKDVRFKLCLTATPAPNDYMELGSHAEFVGAMSRAQMLATFFVHDGGDTSKWRLKRHARQQFWQWVSTWAKVFAHPSDIGFEQHGYDLPDLEVFHHRIEVDGTDLFGGAVVNATNLYSTLRDSADVRAQKCADIVNAEPDEPWLIWVNTNDEQQAVTRVLGGCVTVQGSDTREAKEDRLLGFASGKYKRLVTKPKIAGFGMNWQQCARMIFCGVNYSFEQQYQAVRRCYRFGQTRPVHVHYITASTMDGVLSSVEFKAQASTSMVKEIKEANGY